MAKLRERLPIILSVTALVVAVFGATPVGNAVDAVLFAKNAGKVDGIDASKTPKAGDLLALNGNKKFPASVVGGISSFDILNGAKCTRDGKVGAIQLQYNDNRTAVLNCITPIDPDAFEPNNDKTSATARMFGSLSQIEGTLPSGDDDWFTFTCDDTVVTGDCADNQLMIFTEFALLDGYRTGFNGGASPEVENTDNWTINPLTDGEQIWVHVYSESSLEHYTLNFDLQPASP
ncbi:MAG TPA: hypothetical protein VJU01_04040 [Gaiellaceae bacterium]|nr:hypothetical protein [Gaiellaceae bacterium]